MGGTQPTDLNLKTAEKREQLETKGEPWPDCECHDTPMGWSRNTALLAGGRFVCLVDARERKYKIWAKRKAEGLCLRCGDPAETETLCREHAVYHNNLMGKGKQAMNHQLAQIRYRRRKRGET